MSRKTSAAPMPVVRELTVIAVLALATRHEPVYRKVRHEYRVSLRWVFGGENTTSGGFSAYSALTDVQVRNRSRTPRAALTSR